ncbi:MAG: head GIN domain-containing protein [Ginsengibacter sp.]
MKKLLIPFLMLMGLNLNAQILKSIKGDGNLKTEVREVSGFTSLSSRGSIEVQINYGNTNNIKVEADENLLPYIETTVDDGTLLVQFKKNLNLKPRSKMVVYVSMNKIKNLQLSGSGNINGTGEFGSDEQTKVNISGSGNINLNSVSFKDAELNISGSGNIELKKGNVENLKASVSGSGNIDCSGVTSQNVVVKISGSGNASVNVNKDLSASINGSGNVYYKGKATNITTKVAGSGKAIRM